MKKINKLLITFILIVLCTGCSVDYTIEVKNNTIDEVIKVNDKVMADRTKEDIYNEYQRWVPIYTDAFGDVAMMYDSSIKIDGIEYYNKSIDELSNGYNYTYKYTHPIKKYNDVLLLKQAYETSNAYVGYDYITFKTDKVNLLCNYSYFENLKINIKIDKEYYKVRNTNAPIVNGDIYTWNLHRNNCEDSEIILVLDKIKIDSQNSTIKDNNTTSSDYTMYIFAGILIVLILIGYFILNKLKNKNNNFNIDD